MKDYQEMVEINNEHLKQMENLSIQRENNQMENNRKLEEMKLKDENEKIKINNSHARIMQKMSDEREDRERKENHLHEEELKKGK